MTIVDTSAVVAILQNEPEAEAIERLLASAEAPRMSAATWVEVAIVAETRFGPAGVELCRRILAEARVAIVDVTADLAEESLHAYRRFGKGRHPAALNFGDTFAYALGSTSGEPVLCVGNDFAQTDVDTLP